MDQQTIKIPTIQETEQNWNHFSTIYTKFDTTPQSFYYAIINMLNLTSANNILEIGAGACLLLPYSLEIKNRQAKYFATDLSEGMLEIGRNRLKRHLEKYQTKLSLEEWMEKNRLVIKKANGEQPLEFGHKFDRIICNMVVMLTQSAEKMLTNLYNEAESGCLMGVSIWGDKAYNLFHPLIEQSIREHGVETPKSRSNFYLYNQLDKLANKIGWKTVVCWEQVAAFPYLKAGDCDAQINAKLKGLTCQQQTKKAIFKTFMDKIQTVLGGNKALTFAAQIYIFRKQ